MSQIDLKQRFVNDQIYISQIKLPNTITASLDYCEYLIGVQFCEADKSKLKIKNRKRQIKRQLVDALKELSRQEKVQYYCKQVAYIKSFLNNNFEPPQCKYTGMINDIGYSRSYNVKRWKDKKLRFDLETHLMYAERQTKIKTYDMRDYLLRKSKNKDYYCFVLEAVNGNPHQKSKTVHIGFTQIGKFNTWWEIIDYSTSFRTWQSLLQNFKGTQVSIRPMNGKAFTTDDISIKSKLVNNFVTQFDSSLSQQNPMHQSMMIQRKYQNSSPFLQSKSITISKSIKKEPVLISNVQSEKDRIIKQKKKQMERLQAEIRQIQNQKQNEKKNEKILVEQLQDGEIFQQPDVFEDKLQEQEESSKQTKLRLDIFHRLYPEYQLDQLSSLDNFTVIHEEKDVDLKIYQHNYLQKRLRSIFVFKKQPNHKEKILNFLTKIGKNDLLNQNIQQVQMKTLIASQNSAMMYQVNKQYNKLYRSRDFVFIRHVFSRDSDLFMIDKSIENTNYPPFMTIVRGTFCIVYGIFQKENTTQVVIQYEINQQGLMNPVQQKNLNLKYIKGYIKLFNPNLQSINYEYFTLDWDINKNKNTQIDNEIRSRRRTINQIEKNIEKDQEKPKIIQSSFSKKINRQQSKATKQNNQGLSEYQQKQRVNSVTSQSPKQKRINQTQESEVSSEQRRSKTYTTDINVIRQLDSQGMVIVNQDYCKHHYNIEPVPAQRIFIEEKGQHPIWKGEWIHDDKEGGIIFINKKKIEDQKGVLKFILTKIAKNLLSGQSITTISLPVDIFAAQSNLQRFVYSMTYGPFLFEGLEQENLLTRLLRTIIFGISNSILYLSMQKPFNPILGETFQCWINGCPAYAQQISHHPPIGALMLKGRGYDITAQLESKVSLGVNSGTGTNDGIYKIKFQDGTEICFISPGGEVSGLTAGDRKFNLVGKSYYWINGTNIMLQLVFDPFKKGFFSVGKQEKPSDYFQGTIWQVKPQFMAKFLNGKRREPEEKQRVKDYGKVSGIWNRYICYNNNQIFNFDQSFPLLLEYESYPIPSDANWREDIEYRRRNQVTRAQTQKERLEVMQRKDRKTREKFNKKK